MLKRTLRTCVHAANPPPPRSLLTGLAASTIATTVAPSFSSSQSPSTASERGSIRRFRSKAALDALRTMEEHLGGAGGSVGLYRYPCISGALAALFARLYHARLRLPFLLLPFSSVAPLRESDLKLDFIRTCYLLGFTGPDDFAVNLSRFIPRVIVFDHRISTKTMVSQWKTNGNLETYVHTEKSSASMVYEYFSQKLLLHADVVESPGSLIDSEDEVNVLNMLQHVEDVDLRRWSLPDIRAFTIGLREEHLNLNCITNLYIFDQLLKLDSHDLIQKGDRYICSRQDTAKMMLAKSFKMQLGRGLYGECLCVRADENSSLSHEIGEELSKLSESTGLRPIGAVVFMQRGRMKVCLRSTNNTIDTSEIAKAYGGGGKPCSSSFTIQMDEYNRWISANSS